MKKQEEVIKVDKHVLLWYNKEEIYETFTSLRNIFF
jgi:hypothetical protein